MAVKPSELIFTFTSFGWKYRYNAIALSTYHVGYCPRSKFDVIKILNARFFVVFIFLWRAIIFALIQNFPLYSICMLHRQLTSQTRYRYRWILFNCLFRGYSTYELIPFSLIKTNISFQAINPRYSKHNIQLVTCTSH